MTKHYFSIDELIEDAPPSGPLGGPEIKSSLKVFGYLRYADTIWAVHEDTKAERLVELRDHIAAGHNPIRSTAHGTRALSTGTAPAGLYIYETSSSPDGSGRLTSKRPREGICCYVYAPIGSECASCGKVVATN